MFKSLVDMHRTIAEKAPSSYRGDSGAAVLSEAGDCVPGILYAGAPYTKSVIGDLSLFMPTSWVARALKLLLGAKLSKRPWTLGISFLNIGQFLN